MALAQHQGVMIAYGLKRACPIMPIIMGFMPIIEGLLTVFPALLPLPPARLICMQLCMSGNLPGQKDFDATAVPECRSFQRAD